MVEGTDDCPKVHGQRVHDVQCEISMKSVSPTNKGDRQSAQPILTFPLKGFRSDCRSLGC